MGISVAELKALLEDLDDDIEIQVNVFNKVEVDVASVGLKVDLAGNETVMIEMED